MNIGRAGSGCGHDAVVIGSGVNGLVAANLMADAGWDVLVVEAAGRIGGAVASDTDVAPGFVHDTFSSFYPLAAASPVLHELRLEEYGLRWSHAPAVVGTPERDRPWTLLRNDPEETAAGLDRHHPGDGDAWMDLVTGWRTMGPALVESLLHPFPPVRGGVQALARLPRVGGLSFVRMLLEPSRRLTASRFGGMGARLLIAGNAAHADLPPDAAGSGLFGWLLAMLAQDVGFPVPCGGAGELAGALANRLRAQGGQIRCDTRVADVQIEQGRAVGVRVAAGERIAARRAVIADVAATQLYGGLVSWDELPARTRRGMQHFEWDPGTVKVDWALDRPVPWAETPSVAPGTVHLADSVDHIARSMTEVAGHRIPARPFLLIGQMTQADPSRSPRGTESMWAYTHVPHRVTGDLGDSGGAAITGSWDASDAERMADRIQSRIEEFAPGFGSRVRARRVLTPRDLERRDANLVGGSINGGTAGLHQQLIFRPMPGNGRASTPIRGLFLGSASAHPGGGVHGACGANAARAALFWDRVSAPRRLAGRM